MVFHRLHDLLWRQRYRSFPHLPMSRARATLRPNDLVIMDNLSPCKSEPTLGLIRRDRGRLGSGQRQRCEPLVRLLRL